MTCPSIYLRSARREETGSQRPPRQHSFRQKPAISTLDSATFGVFDSAKDMRLYAKAVREGTLLATAGYARYGGPNQFRTAMQLLHLTLKGHIASDYDFDRFVGSDPLTAKYDAFLTDCGMSAIRLVIDGLLTSPLQKPELRHQAVANPAHVITGTECYRKCRVVFGTRIESSLLQHTELTTEGFSHIEEVLKAKPNTRIVLLELPTNPFLRVADYLAVREATRRHGVVLVVDTTFASPWNLRLLTGPHAADIVVESGAKFLNGKNDGESGIVMGRRDLLKIILAHQGAEGGILNADGAYRLMEGIETLPLRMPQHNRNALKLAHYLGKHPRVERVWYPLHPTHPDFSRARVMLPHGAGGVVTFKLRCDSARPGDERSQLRRERAATDAFLNALQRFRISESFGGMSPMIQGVLDTSYGAMPPADRARLGITPTLLRMSVGVDQGEGPQSQIDDLERGFAALEASLK